MKHQSAVLNCWYYTRTLLKNLNVKISCFQEAQKLQEYGVLFHKVSKFKKDRRGGFSLGICVRGMLVYEV